MTPSFMLSEGVHFGPCEHYDEVSRDAGLEIVCSSCREYDAALENTLRELRRRLDQAESERALRIRARIERSQAVLTKTAAHEETKR